MEGDEGSVDHRWQQVSDGKQSTLSQEGMIVYILGHDVVAGEGKSP